MSELSVTAVSASPEALMHSTIDCPDSSPDIKPETSRRARWGRRALVGSLMVGSFLAMPTESHAAIFDIFKSLLTLVSGPIGDSLKSINEVATSAQKLYQDTAYPLNQINQARGFSLQSINTYRPTMHSIFNSFTGSATLPGPQQFEALLHSRDSSQLLPLQLSYLQNYGTVPVANNAAPRDRVMIDTDDALGEENLKTTVVSDQAQDGILATADAIENQGAVSAPGSAPFLTAQAQVASLRSQAYMQKMLAAELRQEAGRIAHDNALTKRSSDSIGSFAQQITSTLTH